MRSFSKSQALYERAARVIPGGIPGHQTPRFLVWGKSPYFVERAEGCRFWDADGNEYIDYMCAYGPMILGYNHPKVELAVRQQKEKGDCFNLPSQAWVELAEYLVALIASADWALFGKNGSDAVNCAVMVARAHTGKRKIIMAEGTYHGIGPWCIPNTTGITQEDRVNVLTFPYNEPEILEKILQTNQDDAAAIIVTPFKHEFAHDQEMPTDAFLSCLKTICKPEGPVLIMDDVRAGFRLHMAGSAEYFGLKPQLTCFSKALGNGYPISACVGTKELMGAGRKIFFTGSFFTSAVPMAAALATLDEMVRTEALKHTFQMGEKLKQGMLKQAEDLGLTINYTGPPTIPFMTFKDDPSFEKAKTFCAAAYQKGAFFHPYHNWFISAAHKEEDIEQTLAITQEAFKEVKEAFS
ncbi:MAG: aminotransferase class III-fold pyridoxal phosphate-dependent enzyme [Deltaproteobacteria bacterium]|nr:aminotransferase class III-fold pyridoxal phosphate-dependent enzyme [Deltaproteobacteria bacterium]